MDIRFYFALLMRRLHYILLFVIVGTALGATLALVLPSRYVSKARLVVESQQIPDELAASTVQIEATEQLQIIRQRILARDTLLDLADDYGVYDRTDGNALSPDDIVSDMRVRIGIDTTGGTSSDATLVDVSFSASDAQLSSAVANQIVTLILQENVEMRRTVSGQTVDFFDGEVQRLDRELAGRSAEVALFQEQNRDALPESLEFRRSQLLGAQERAVEVARDVDQLRDRRRSLETLFEQTGGLGLVAREDLSAEARELQRLKERYASSSAVMSETNPRQKVLRQQIDVLEAIVAEQAAGGTGVAAGVPSAYDIQLADIDNQVAFLEGWRDDMAGQIEELTRTINATPNNAITLGGLLRDLENVRLQYDRAVEARARAETGDAIEALSKGQRISIIENAIAPDAPNSPNRRKVLAAGVGGGLLLGFGLVALLELLNMSVRRAADIEVALDITPIATLSYMRTRKEIIRRRILILAVFAVMGLGIPAAIWALDTYYKPVDLLFQSLLDKLPDIPFLTGTQTGEP